MTSAGAPTPQQDFWQVRVLLHPDEWDAVRRSLFIVLPSERWSIGLSPGEDSETATLQITVSAASAAEAEAAARDAYLSARLDAGLPEREPLTIGVRASGYGEVPHARLLEESRRLIESDRTDLAVVRAQTACEMFAREALVELTEDLREPDERLRNLFPNGYALVDRRSRALLQLLTGSSIHTQDWWPTYRAHVQRRNDVIHEGLLVSKAEADQSLGVARQFIGYLEWLAARTATRSFRLSLDRLDGGRHLQAVSG